MTARRLARPGSRDSAPADAVGTPKAVDLLPFPVVGIGASAGGLEAVSQLLEHIPADIGIAVCIVQHLAPNHESLLAELLGHKSSLLVSEVTDGLAVEAGHAYVIPPGADMRLEGKRLHLATRDPAQRPPMPIDGFFRTLAAALGPHAIGVVLSGAASDGTLGLGAIRAEGGMTFAQEPKSAKYDGMPLAAIAANVVDFVLTPRRIAVELKRLAGHPYVTSPRVAVSLAEPAAARDLYAQIFTLLRQAFGVDFTHYKSSTIGRRVSRRVALRHLDRLEEYVALLRDDPVELHSLFQDILIRVTEFFREPQTFAALRDEVFPKLIEGRSRDRELRLWVPGCASGEEAYSLAMALSDFLEGRAAPPAVKIFATDVNQVAIDRARPGVYGENIAGSVPVDYLERYFAKIDKGYQVVKPIREQCIFATHDLTRDPPFSRLDLISCRNLLIYLDAALQKRVIPTLHYALSPGGYLVLGSAESVGSHADLFEVVDKKPRIYRARDRTPHPRVDLWPGQLVGAAPVVTRTQRRTVAPVEQPFDIDRAVDEIVLSDYAPPAVVVDDRLEIIGFRGETEPYLRHTSGKATFDLLAMAGEENAVHLGGAIGEARRTGKPVTRRDLPLGSKGREEIFHVHVAPLVAPGNDLYFVVLFERAQGDTTAGSDAGRTKTARTKTKDLEHELAATRTYLQAVIEDKETGNEELRAANEEVQSANEELQSTNEELETAKEELQSTNEELVTVNDELSGRNAELNALTDDLSNLFASTDIPIIMVDRELHLTRVTPATHDVFAISPDALGRPLADLELPIELPELPSLVTGVIDTLSPLVKEVRDRQGRWYSLRVRPYRATGATVEGAVVALVDIDQTKRSAEQVKETSRLNTALAGIHLAISSTLEIDEILGRAVMESAEALQAETASIAVREEGAWVTRYTYGYDAGVLGTRFSDTDLPHVALAAGSKAPVAISHAGEDERIGLDIVRVLKLRSVLAVPLVSKDEVIGVLLFNWHDRRVSFSDSQIDFAAKLASSVSLALDNGRMYGERSESVRLAEALNSIGVAISAAHGVEPIVRLLAGEGLNVLGCEGAVAVLAEGEEFVTRIAVGAAQPLLGQRFRRDENPIGELAVTRNAFVSNDARRDPRLVAGFAERFGLRSLLFVPLVIREELTGVLAFANLSAATPFTDDQVRFAAALATSGSLAIENAHSYEIEHRTAETLRKLLAFPLPELPTLRIGAAHRAAAEAERVGGDFFDVFAVGEHSVAVFIADVSGKGVRAAGFTETVRSAVRALAYIDPAPAFVLDHVNRSLMRQDTGRLFATAALFVIDIETGEVRYSSAGHPPAIICGESCVEVPTQPAVPLGTFPHAYEEQALHLEPHEVLIAYTDGITEARRGKTLFGETRLLAQLSRSRSRDPQDLADGVMAGAIQFAGGTLSDDAAIIAVSLAAD